MGLLIAMIFLLPIFVSADPRKHNKFLEPSNLATPDRMEEYLDRISNYIIRTETPRYGKRAGPSRSVVYAPNQRRELLPSQIKYLTHVYEALQSNTTNKALSKDDVATLWRRLFKRYGYHRTVNANTNKIIN